MRKWSPPTAPISRKTSIASSQNTAPGWPTIFTPQLRKADQEFFFSTMQPFYKATVIYVLALVLALLSWFGGGGATATHKAPTFNVSDLLRRSAFYFVMLAWVIHTFGLVFRMYLEGRPPVTNLYSSAIFIGWGAVILGMVLEKIYRDGIGCVVAGSAASSR